MTKKVRKLTARVGASPATVVFWVCALLRTPPCAAGRRSGGEREWTGVGRKQGACVRWWWEVLAQWTSELQV